jgi:hypothetical protein
MEHNNAKRSTLTNCENKLGFRALLTDGARQMRFERMTVG